jgi:hypothetical protein
MRRLLPLCFAALLTGCGQEMAMTNDTSAGTYAETARPIVDPVGIRPIPPIPAALHGCWVPIPPEDPEEPHGDNRLLVDATTITQEAGGGEPRRVATADFVTSISRTQVEGRFSYRDNGGGTLATSLSIGPDNVDTPPGILRRAEGDAGSVHYRRCAP